MTFHQSGARFSHKQLEAELCVEGSRLKIGLTWKGRARSLYLHDTIARGGVSYALFHEKTQMFSDGDALVARCAAISAADGAPLSGLIITYRFTFLPDTGAVCVTTSVGSDLAMRGCVYRFLELSHEGLSFDTLTGYEHSPGGPFSRAYAISGMNPNPLSYEESLKLNYSQLLEIMGAQPKAFREAIALSGENDFLALVAGNPTWMPSTGMLSAHPELLKMPGDLRFFSEGNPLCAWLLLEKPKDMFETLASLPMPAATPEAPRHDAIEPLTVTAGALRVRLAKTRGGVWLAGVGENAQPGGMFPLFHLTLWDTMYEKEIELDSGEGWEAVEIRHGGRFLHCMLSDPGNGTYAGIAVTVEAVLSPTQNRMEWKCAVLNASDRYAIQAMSYPNCLWGGELDAFVPSNSGVVIDAFTRGARAYGGAYPMGCNSPMSFFALYGAEGGLYVGVHDPQGSYRRHCVASAPIAKQVMISVDCPAVNVHRAGNCFTLPGVMVWQTFAGDWYDATQIYKAFVYEKAQWLSPLRGRPDSPQWLRETPLWITSFMPNDNPDANPVPVTLRPAVSDPDPDAWYKQAVRLREALGVPIAYHVYNWHWVPFNNDNPHYFPTKPNFHKGVRALHEAGVRVMPYMAAYSWDMHDCRGDDDRFLTEAEPNTAHNEAGEIVRKSYASKEPNGVPVAFARMCPSTAFWKREVRRVVRRLYDDYEVDGIYLDVVSAQYDHCCDPRHNHLPGYGHSWGDAYCELIQYLRVGAPPEFAVTSESCAEVYASALDAFLTWQWNHVGLVPAFPQVYGGRVAMFGRNMTALNRDDIPYFKFHIAQSLLYGQQLGWIHPEVVDDERRLPFLKKMVRLRWDYREFFTEAAMLRPPVVTGCTEFLHAEPALRETMLTHEPRVLSACWEGALGERVLFVVNTSARAVRCALTAPAGEYGTEAKISAALPGEGCIWTEDVRGENVQWGAELEPDGCLVVRLCTS